MTHWHHRGYLPHFDGAKVYQSVTYRLADALPREVVDRLATECRDQTDEDERSRRLRQKIEAWLDTGHGACLLGRQEIADLVVGAWKHFDGERNILEAFVVMPNHVHVLVQTDERHPLSAIIQSWKTFTAKRILKSTGGCGPVWQADYWDRFVRDADHFARVVSYIQGNPVKAGLVAEESAWRWSSAWRG